MKNSNEKNPSAEKSGRDSFCPLSSSARAATRQSGLVFAGLAEETIFNSPMIPDSFQIRKSGFVFIRPSYARWGLPRKSAVAEFRQVPNFRRGVL